MNASILRDPSLAQLAALQGDIDLPKIPPLRKPLTDSTLEEVNYAAGLYERAAKALDEELGYLRGTGVRIDWALFWRATSDLLLCQSHLRMLAIEHQLALKAQKGGAA